MSLTREAGFGPEVKRRIILGTYALSSGYYDAYYGQAQKVRTLISRDFAAAFETVDVLVSPTTPTVAFPIGERVDDPLAMYAADLCTLPASLAGLPAISVPCGLSEGLPVGLQVMAPALADDRCYRVAAALEADHGRPADRGGPGAVTTAESTVDRDRRRGEPVRAGHRAGDARRARHRVEDVLRLPDHVRRRAQHPDLPGLPRPARLAAGGQRGRDRVHHPDRARAALRDRGVVPVRPEELLLPGHAEELPDQPVRRAAVHRRLPRRRRSTARPSGWRSSGCTWRRTPARRCTSAAPPAASTAPTTRWSTTTGPASRWSRSSPGRSPAPARAPPRSARAYVTELREHPARARRLATCGWSRARCAATSTSRSRRPARESWAPAPRPRTSTRCARSSGRSGSR